MKKVKSEMIFGDKLNVNNFSENGSSKAHEKSSAHSEPFSFSALHFLRNRLLPGGEKVEENKQFQLLPLD